MIAIATALVISLFLWMALEYLLAEDNEDE